MNLQLSQLAPALVGGLLIGAAAGVLVVGIGRIAGISSIFEGALLGTDNPQDQAWRRYFLMGLFVSPWCWRILVGPFPGFQVNAGAIQLVIAGLLVGVGTPLGMGCTSGHGICGLSRFSRRSMLATLTFMAVAMLTVALMRGRLI